MTARAVESSKSLSKTSSNLFIMESVKSAQNILVVYEQNDTVTPFVEDLKKKTSGAITSKLISELTGEVPTTYDFILSGYASQHGLNHDDNLLSIFLKVLKPNGIVVLRQVVSSQNQILSKLKLTGFTKVAENRVVNVSDEEIVALKQKLNVEGEVSVVEVSCAKPNFEVGSSAKLSFASKKVDVASVWKIDNNLDDDDDAIDPDTLLDEDDLKKPDPTSLRVCGTTGKRKACKDCSCGLAEELDVEANGGVAPAPLPKSSCGSCYLGDAFRCASCPYLGMPAFKPGEKIQLAGNQLQADI